MIIRIAFSLLRKEKIIFPEGCDVDMTLKVK